MAKLQQLAVTPDGKVYIMAVDEKTKKAEICEVIIPEAKEALKKIFNMEIFK